MKHPDWMEKRCQLCKEGWPIKDQYGNLNHFRMEVKKRGFGYSQKWIPIGRCSAPTAQEYIEELQAEIARLTKNSMSY